MHNKQTKKDNNYYHSTSCLLSCSLVLDRTCSRYSIHRYKRTQQGWIHVNIYRRDIQAWGGWDGIQNIRRLMETTLDVV